MEQPQGLLQHQSSPVRAKTQEYTKQRHIIFIQLSVLSGKANFQWAPCQTNCTTEKGLGNSSIKWKNMGWCHRNSSCLRWTESLCPPPPNPVPMLKPQLNGTWKVMSAIIGTDVEEGCLQARNSYQEPKWPILWSWSGLKYWLAKSLEYIQPNSADLKMI